MLNYKFVKDDSGHDYLLPQSLWSTWDQLLALGEDGLADERWAGIERCRIDGVGEWCFMSPVKVQSLRPDTLRRTKGRREIGADIVDAPMSDEELNPEPQPDEG